ncbi:MAG: protein kinase, partial [Chloroflexota bacterium]
RGRRRITQSGAIVGTPEYMSPEHILAPERVEARSDIYSLGVVLYEMLTGTPLFTGTIPQVLQHILYDEPRRPRLVNERIPANLETIALCCLRKEPERRYRDAAALASDLQRFLHGEPILARPAGVVERIQLWVKRRPAIAALLGLLVIAFVLGFVGVAWQWRQTEAARVDEVKQRQQAETTLYFSRIAQAELAWRVNDVGRAELLLEQCLPKGDGADLRGWEWHYLKRLCHSDQLTLRGHEQWVYGVAFSPDGRRVASVGGDPYTVGKPGEIRVWDAQTGEEVIRLTGHTWALCSVAFSPDGRLLAAAGGDLVHKDLPGELIVWDIETGRVVLNDKERLNQLWTVAFSPDGKRVAAGRSGVTVWDVATGQRFRTIPKERGDIFAVAFSPDGQWLAGAGGTGTVRICNAVTGEERLTLRGHGQPADPGDEPFRDPLKFGSQYGKFSVTFSPDGQWLAAASGNTLLVWDAATGEQLQTMRGHTGWVWSVAFSPDGRQLASASSDATVRIWDRQSGAELLILRGHTWAVRGVAFSPDGRRLVSGSQEGTVRLWDLTRHPESLTLRGHRYFLGDITFASDGTHLYAADLYGKLRTWDATTGAKRAEHSLDLIGRFRWPLTDTALRADGRQLAAVSGDERVVKLWDVATGQEVRTLRGHTAAVTAVTYSPDGAQLATAAAEGDRPGGPAEVRIWNVTTGAELVRFPAHRNAVTCLAYSPDGRRLATAGHDKTARLWDPATGQELRVLSGHDSAVSSIAFSPDGKLLATGGYSDRTVRLWDAATGN